MSTRTHRPLSTIIGAGQIGSVLATHLLARGHRVRIVRRSGATQQHPDLEHWLGDIADVELARAATAGSSVIYHCANPAYHRWHQELLPMTRGILAGAIASGARLVVLDNLYMFGAPDVPIGERTAYAPRSVKGRLRVRAQRELIAALPSSRLAIIIGSDFFGPDTPRSTVFHPRAMARLRAGKAVEVFGNPDVPHSYTFTGDVVTTLATLGEAERIELAGGSPIWMVPTGFHGTTRELFELLAAELGTVATLRRVPSWLLTAVGLFSATAREIREMLYQWERPFIIDDSRVRRLFGLEPTPIDEAVARTCSPVEPLQGMPAAANIGR